MLKKILVLGGIVLFLLCGWVWGGGQPKVPPKVQTKLGKYVSPTQAYAMWRQDPDRIKILDCRTPEEYVFVGHPPMAYNIPFQLWTGKWDGERKTFILADNPNFLDRAREKFQPQDTILILCSSGGRSAKAADGFKNVGNVKKVLQKGLP